MKDSQKSHKNSSSLFNYLPFSIRDVIITVLPVFLIGILILVNQQLFAIQQEIDNNQLNTVESFTVAPYPKIQEIIPISSRLPITAQLHSPTSSLISAHSAIVVDNDSQIVLFSKNPTTIFPMASTTKIMTALVALDTYQLDDVLTIKSQGVDGAVVGFLKDERFYFKDLLYAMLLSSGNDAAVAISQNDPGGEVAFKNKMNEKAFLLHLSNTRFFDVTGLNENNTTTAHDLAKLSSFAMRNDIFAQTVGTKQKVIASLEGKVYTLNNLNRLLGIDGVNGIKTGFTEEAGEVLATSRIINGHTIITVVMKSKNRFLDTQNLLTFINKNISYLEVKRLLQE